MIKQLLLVFFVSISLLYVGCSTYKKSINDQGKVFFSPHAGEKHIKNIQQLTFGGENAEAYFSPDGKELIFQSTRGKHECDQIYIMSSDGTGAPFLVSTGKGRTTCSYFYPGAERILYSSTHAVDGNCPPKPSYENGYVWALYPGYEIYTANSDGTDLKPLAPADGYDAEATISPDGSKIVFTSTRNGDLDLYVMNSDGTNIKQLTREIGYDGGAFFSPDNSKIVYRAHHPTTTKDIDDYQKLLKGHLIRPTTLEIFVMNADGTNKKQITHNGAANFAPYFHPSGEKIIFSSNLHNPKGRNFDLFLINIDGTGLEQVTFDETFDSFPMFSPDGHKLAWASNRHDEKPGETNIFIADWVE